MGFFSEIIRDSRKPWRLATRRGAGLGIEGGESLFGSHVWGDSEFKTGRENDRSAVEASHMLQLPESVNPPYEETSQEYTTEGISYQVESTEIEPADSEGSVDAVISPEESEIEGHYDVHYDVQYDVPHDTFPVKTGKGSNAQIIENSESMVREEGGRSTAEASSTASSGESAARQVAVPSPSEYTRVMELPKAKDRFNTHPNPETRKLTGLISPHVVTAQAGTAREGVSHDVGSAEMEFVNSEDLCVMEPLSIRPEQSARGKSAETQGSRSAGVTTRAGTATPPYFLRTEGEDIETPRAEPHLPGQNRISWPLSYFSPRDQRRSLTEFPWKKDVQTASAEPRSPRVQIGVIEVIVNEPENTPRSRNRKGLKSSLNLASRYYLRNL